MLEFGSINTDKVESQKPDIEGEAEKVRVLILGSGPA